MPEAMGCNIGNHLFHIFPDLADIINHRRQQTVEPIDDPITSTLNSERPIWTLIEDNEEHNEQVMS